MEDPVLTDCQVCEARVSAHVRGEIVEDAVSPARYLLLECPQCGSPILAHQQALSLTPNNDFIWARANRIFPESRSSHPLVPPSIRRSFDEALICLNARALLACVVMCRKTIEGLALHHYGKIRDLSSALEKLNTDNIIDDRLCEWASALRKTGNFAVHDPEAVISLEDARDLVDFTEAILQYVFVLRDRFEDFKRRKNEPGEGN
jgi:hypothetical protein